VLPQADATWDVKPQTKYLQGTKQGSAKNPNPNPISNGIRDDKNSSKQTIDNFIL